MYKVKIDDSYIYHPWDKNLQIYDAIFEAELNKNGSFQFELPATNPMYDSIQKLKSEVRIIRFTKTMKEKEIFHGRVLNDGIAFDNEKSVECEGDLAFTLDSILRPYEVTADPATHFENFINLHNAQTDESKKFELGKVTVTGEQTKIKVFSYPKIRDVLEEQLINVFGGYVRIRKENEKYYADYMADFGRTAVQEIRFGENLIDLTKYIKAENVKTCIIPLGATNSASGKPVTIESVNNGLDYLCDDAAVKLFGTIYDTVEYPEISDPNKLKEKGQRELDDIKNLVVTIELTAVDLNDLGVDIEAIEVGDLVHAISEPHGIDTYIKVSKKSINLKKPTDSKITLGTSLKTLTNSYSSLAAVGREVQEVKGQVSTKITAEEGEEIATNAIRTVKKEVDGTVDRIRPVNSIYLSAVEVDPASLFGGAWVLIEQTVLPDVYLYKRIEEEQEE